MAKCCDISSGDLDEQITIQERDPLGDSIGGSSDNWYDIIDTWAKIEDVSGSESVRNGRLQSEVTHKITVRYDELITGVSQIVLWEGMRLRVEYVKELHPRRRFQELHCKSLVPV